MPTSAKSVRRKPNKPHPDFPLFAHTRGYWCKKIKGKQWNFGPWVDPEAALQKYLDEKDIILAGRDPRAVGAAANGEGLTVQDACNYFLTAKEADTAAGRLTQRTFKEYLDECKLICAALGKITHVESLTPQDFQLLRKSYPKSWGIRTVDGHITRSKTVFKYVFEDGMLDRPVNFGNGFKKAPKKQHDRIRQQKKAARGTLEYSREDVHLILNNTSGWRKACALLGIQAGFGNEDCARLTVNVINFDTGWIDYGRGKTGEDRRFPMWPETAAAIREAMSKRPVPKNGEHEDLCFLTSHGFPLKHERLNDDGSFNLTDNVGLSFGKLLRKLKIHRPDLSFYSLRRTFATVAQDAGDAEAKNYVMGHSDSSMPGLYRQRMSSQRIEEVVEFVRNWLFGADV
ncbi:MAG: tyrosine-type recombinase/integrase [Fuerstiella sp.]